MPFFVQIGLKMEAGDCVCAGYIREVAVHSKKTNMTRRSSRTICKC